MARIYAVLTALLLTLFIAAGCGSDGSSEAKSIMKKQASITENYVNDLKKAANADDMVKAINAYTQGMKELIPDLKEFQKKFPEYRHGKVPEGMEADAKRLEEISAQIPDALMKTASYMLDPKVQQAMHQMGQEMSKLQ